jgi:hypothetical protein
MINTTKLNLSIYRKDFRQAVATLPMSQDCQRGNRVLTWLEIGVTEKLIASIFTTTVLPVFLS